MIATRWQWVLDVGAPRLAETRSDQAGAEPGDLEVSDDLVPIGTSAPDLDLYHSLNDLQTASDQIHVPKTARYSIFRVDQTCLMPEITSDDSRPRISKWSLRSLGIASVSSIYSDARSILRKHY